MVEKKNSAAVDQVINTMLEKPTFDPNVGQPLKRGLKEYLEVEEGKTMLCHSHSCILSGRQHPPAVLEEQVRHVAVLEGPEAGLDALCEINTHP